MALATTFPGFVVISVNSMPGLVYYKNESEIVCGEDVDVFNTLAKIEVERAKIDNDLIHLRICGTNKYLARAQDAVGYIVANSNQPEEDESKSTCTLFRPTLGEAQSFFLNHVQSRGSVQLSDSGSRLYVNDDPNNYHNSFYYRDWESFVKLPKHVAFKGDNGKYLKAFFVDLLSPLPHTVLQFSSDDPNDELSGHEVQQMPDGYVRIKSVHNGKFWKRITDEIWTPGSHWICADSSDAVSNDDTLFWPIKIDDSTIALLSKGNNNFCKHSYMSLKDCLIAAVPTITTEARLVVQPLLLGINIYNVTYHMEYARVYGVQPYLAGTTTAVNNEDVEASIGVSIPYTDQKSHSFSKGVSLTAGVTTTVEANILELVKGSIQVSVSVTGTLEWNDTTITETSVTATGSVPVPPKSSVVVHYVGSKGSCNVPFSYTQKFKSSTDGKTTITEEVDGIFTGVNCYDFNFEFGEITAL